MYLVVINQFYNLRSLLFTYDDSSLMNRHSMYFEQLRHQEKIHVSNFVSGIDIKNTSTV